MQQVKEETRPKDQSSSDKNGDGRGMLADLPIRGLAYHAVLYLGVVLILLAVNLRVAPDTLWVVWIALLWGLLLVWNAWQVFRPGSRDQR
ncbi:2TM domain-containing protein [Methanogenium cariaci]|jgi:2TM domain-containing protein